MTKLYGIWRSCASKFKLYKCLVFSILLYGYETWTRLLREGTRLSRLHASQETSPHLLLGAQDQRMRADQDHFLCGPTEISSGNCQETVSQMVRACHASQLQPLWNHPPRRRRGRQRKCWTDNIKDWTSLPMPELLTMASCRKKWKRTSAESFLMFLRGPDRSRDWTELKWTYPQACPCKFRKKKQANKQSKNSHSLCWVILNMATIHANFWCHRHFLLWQHLGVTVYKESPQRRLALAPVLAPSSICSQGRALIFISEELKKFIPFLFCSDTKNDSSPWRMEKHTVLFCLNTEKDNLFYGIKESYFFLFSFLFGRKEGEIHLSGLLSLCLEGKKNFRNCTLTKKLVS